MHKLWQKKLELNYSKNVQDIVQYGSSVIEDNDPNDIDIAVIYKKISLKDQLNESQKIKKQLQKYSELSIHIKSYDFYSLFNNSNFARESILLYGISLISKESFSKTFGLVPKIQISYNLIKFEKKEKVRFHYLLKGNQPIIISLARGIKTRIEPEIKEALNQGRILIISPFHNTVKRVTEATAQIRNQLMIDLADNITVGYISKGGNLDELIHKTKKQILTVN